MNGQGQDITAPSEIEVPFLYLVDTGETPVFRQTDAPADQGALSGTREAHAMTIRNARLLPNEFSLDVEGFAFTAHDTGVADFFDDAQLTAVYTPEVEALIARLAGATEVAVFDHTRRSSDGAQRGRITGAVRFLCRTAITRTPRRRSACATSLATRRMHGSNGALLSSTSGGR